MGILLFAVNYKYFSIALILLNFFLVRTLIRRLNIRTNKMANEAFAGRDENKSLYKKCISLLKDSVEEYEKRDKKAGIYLRAKEKMKKSGYRSKYAPIIYLALKYILVPILFIASILTNYPNIVNPIVLAVGTLFILEAVVRSKRKKHNLKLQRYIYKIYKYLHNQISSGVKVSDAIKTVYEIIEDAELKRIMIQLAAIYELTLDIDAALKEFRSNFNVQEAETLCVAIKQGIMTGDNRELLARQEEVMFKRYFNYIQAETDSCRVRGTIACTMFVTAIVIMIVVPMLNDMKEAVSRIFIN